jgi:hypothetical protein
MTLSLDRPSLLGQARDLGSGEALMFTRWTKTAAAIALGATVSACTTVVDPVARNAPLKLAMTEPVESLQARSEAGDRHAQYALSFLMRTGLRGVERDPLQAEALRARAGQAITRSNAIYVPGVNGNPGHVMMVPTTDPGVSDAEAARMDACAAALLLRQPAMGGAMCGSPAAYIDLLPGAVALRQEMMESALVAVPAVDPASATDCADTDALWSDAALRMALNDHEKAAAAADHIIILCGAARESWHARVMRAQIALDAGDPVLALSVMAPVPLPAPTPIGGFAGLVVMAAHAAGGDWSAHGRERDRLTAASIAALEAEPGARRLEAFAVQGGEATLFERRAALNPGLDSVMVAVVTFSDPAAAPRAFWLTTSPDPLDPGQRSYFLDEYRCDGRATLHLFPRALPTAPTVRDMIERRMVGGLEPVSGSSFPGGPSACQFPAMVAPGLGDDPLVIARHRAVEAGTGPAGVDTAAPPGP